MKIQVDELKRYSGNTGDLQYKQSNKKFDSDEDFGYSTVDEYQNSTVEDEEDEEDEDKVKWELNRFKFVARNLGLSARDILEADGDNEVLKLINDYKMRLSINASNEKIEKYQKFTMKLGYNKNDIYLAKNLDRTVRKLKDKIRKETNEKTYSQLRYGKSGPFNDDERKKLLNYFTPFNIKIGAESKIANAFTRKKAINILSYLLSKNALVDNEKYYLIFYYIDLKQNISKSDCKKFGKKPKYQEFKKNLESQFPFVFEPECYNICRYHTPMEIKSIFLKAQGLS